MSIHNKFAILIFAPLTFALFMAGSSTAQTPVGRATPSEISEVGSETPAPVTTEVLTQAPAQTPVQTSSTRRARIVEDVPGPNERMTNSLIRVTADSTPSGFRVPRYVSLKYSTSNGRTGPSRNHPVAWQYTQRGLPMIVVAETETWRKVRDVNGDETWMKRRLLDGTRTVLVRSELTLRSKPRSDSKKTATAGKGALLRLDTCASGWCRVTNTDKNLSGYALQTLLWGAEPL